MEDKPVTYSVNQCTEEDPDIVKITMQRFDTGYGKEWLCWLRDLYRIADLKGWTVHQVYRNLRLFFVGLVYETFRNLEDYFRHENYDNLQEILRIMSETYLPRNPREMLLNELRTLRKTRDKTVVQHAKEFQQVAGLIRYILNDSTALNDSELVYYYKSTMPAAWQTKLLESGQVFTILPNLINYFRQLDEAADHQRPSPSTNGQQRQNDRQRQNGGHKNGGSKPTKIKSDFYCKLHGKNKLHDTKDCRQGGPPKSGGKPASRQEREEANAMNSYPSVLFPDGEEALPLRATDAPTPAAHEGDNTTTEMIASVQLDEGSTRLVHTLVDIGASCSILRTEIVGTRALGPSTITFNTANGPVPSLRTKESVIQFPEVTMQRSVQFEFQVLSTLPYPVVIGRDLLKKLGMVIDFSKQTIEWQAPERNRLRHPRQLPPGGRCLTRSTRVRPRHDERRRATRRVVQRPRASTATRASGQRTRELDSHPAPVSRRRLRPSAGFPRRSSQARLTHARSFPSRRSARQRHHPNHAQQSRRDHPHPPRQTLESWGRYVVKTC